MSVLQKDGGLHVTGQKGASSKTEVYNFTIKFEQGEI